MKIYSIFRRKEDKLNLDNSVFLQEGFSFLATIFTSLWFIYHKMWYASFFCILFSVLLGYLHTNEIISSQLFVSIKLFFMLSIGLFATDLRCLNLKAKDYIIHDVVAGINIEDIEYKYFKRNKS